MDDGQLGKLAAQDVDDDLQSCPTAHEPERGVGLQRGMSSKRGAKRSLEDDRDTSHRTDTHLDQIRAFLDGNEAADFQPTHRDFAYALVRRTLVRFEYHTSGSGPLHRP